MSSFRLLTNQVKYHEWAYLRLITTIQNNTIHHDNNNIWKEPIEGLFFKNIHATLQHCLMAEILWFDRIVNGLKPLSSSEEEEIKENSSNDGGSVVIEISSENNSFKITRSELYKFWQDDHKIDELTTCIGNTEVVCQLLLAQCTKWKELVDSLITNYDPTTFESQKIHYFSTTNDLMEQYLSDALFHIFNHATHHRGQCTVGVYSMTRKVVELDFTYFLNSLK